MYKEFELQKVCYLPLNTFLLKPIQRLLHYRLLLRRLCGHYTPGHHDYADCRGECGCGPASRRSDQWLGGRGGFARPEDFLHWEAQESTPLGPGPQWSALALALPPVSSGCWQRAGPRLHQVSAYSAPPPAGKALPISTSEQCRE